MDTGYLGHPTIVNHVETLALAARILGNGAAWFPEVGTDRSTGTKLFSVSGDCLRPGVYEFPMGITIEALLREAGGENAKAVQVGGAAGHRVPRAHFSRSLAFEDASTGGSVIVFGPHRDMLAVARNFMEFFVEESCGQRTPCRFGNLKLWEGIRSLEEGRCSLSRRMELKALGETRQLASECGLGPSGPNAFLSILAPFEDEILGRRVLHGGPGEVRPRRHPRRRNRSTPEGPPPTRGPTRSPRLPPLLHGHRGKGPPSDRRR